jgi:hypothetical protein
MALMFPRELTGPRATDDDERRVYEALKRELDDRWWVFYDRTIVAHGEAGRIDFVLVHPARGIALLAVAGEDVEIAEEPAREAMRDMLTGAGFQDLFGSVPAISVLRADPIRLDGLGSRVDDAFATSPPATPGDRDWVEWVADRLSRPDDFDMSAAAPAAFTGAADRAAAPERVSVPADAAVDDGLPGFTGPARRQTAVVGGGAALILLAAIAIAWPHGEHAAAPPALSAPSPAAAEAAAPPPPRPIIATAPIGEDEVAPRSELTGGAEPPTSDAVPEAAPPEPVDHSARHAAQPTRAVRGERPRATVARHAQHRRERAPWWQRIEPGTPHLNQNNRAN